MRFSSKYALSVAVLAGLAAGLPALAEQASLGNAAAAQKYRSLGEAVTPAPDGTIFCEAEEFKIEKQGWKAGNWGENYYAATFANSFLSRKAFLGAPEDCEETVATINVDVKEAGRYLVLVRYEAAYRFETQFRLKVEQAGQTKLDRLYGARKNLKIWAFRSKLKTEVAWYWGAVENTVSEGHDAYADLQPGAAKITLTAGKQPGPQARRNVDVVMLTRDEAQVKERIEKENYLPLDGWLTQAGDVYLKITNPGEAKIKVTSGGQEHSPYWVHIRKWKAFAAEVEPGKTTDWLAVENLDALNDGQWNIGSTGPCKIEVGIKNAAGQIESLRTFDCAGKLALVYYADFRYCRKIQTCAEACQELTDYVKSLQLPGRLPSQTMILGSGGLSKDFYDFYGLNGVLMKSANGAIDWRGKGPAQLEAKCKKLGEAGCRNMFVMSLGDEIGLPAPNAEAASAGFAEFLKGHGVSPNDVDPATSGDWSKVAYGLDPELRETKPGLYYWSRRFLYHYGIQAQKTLTDALRKYMPNVHVGANFSPHHGGSTHSYLGEVFKWVTCFRQDGMTLPWSEDYIWQVPVGTAQMNGINLDLFRAGNRGKPDREILYYVMPHFPGNTPNMWRRLWHNAIGHGATILNLFEFDPVWAAYTENHVTGKEMYAAVLKAIRELGLYEDIIQSGQVRQAEVGLWFSETGDIWGDNWPSYGAAKRGLYIAILNQQVPLDFIVEQDALDGTLNQYKVLYLTDNHVTRAASARIADWVKNGGKLFATAGAGLLDEANQPNAVLRELLGVEQAELVMPADQQVHFIKQDTAFAEAIEKVTMGGTEGGTSFPVFGIVSKIKAGTDARAQGTFADQSPAVISRNVGKGETVYCAFLPSLSYFRPAIPMKPLDRGSTDDAMSHFIPTDFDSNVGRLIDSVTADMVPPVVCSEKLVEPSVIQAKRGAVVVLANWSGQPIKDFSLTANIRLPRKASLAGGGTVKKRKEDGKRVYTFDLEVAGDVLILR